MGVGLLLIALGILHIWARDSISAANSAILQRLPLAFPRTGYTARASVLIGCAFILVGLLIVTQSQ